MAPILLLANENIENCPGESLQLLFFYLQFFMLILIFCIFTVFS